MSTQTWAVYSGNNKVTGDLAKRQAYRECRRLNGKRVDGNKPHRVQRGKVKK